jgi:hypothetical protein
MRSTLQLSNGLEKDPHDERMDQLGAMIPDTFQGIA